MKEYIITDDFLDEITKKFAYAQEKLHELVRCKDCASRGMKNDYECYCRLLERWVSVNFYCGYGKGKEE